MKREKMKYQGIYKVGDVYYNTYYVGAKKCEKAVGSNLSIAIKEKMEREGSAKSGKYSVLENQQKMTMEQLIETYRKEGDGKSYILLNSGRYLIHTQIFITRSARCSNPLGSIREGFPGRSSATRLRQ
jgi:hypothetical protein